MTPRPQGPASALNAARRADELGRLDGGRPVDVLVVGGGVTGAGVALDAAARGLSVVLAERHDLAFGTSRWSSKLVHGGLRYLASGQVGVAYESAAERRILLERTAPHLVRPLPQLVPLLPSMSHRHAALVRAGLGAGDALRAGTGTSGQLLPHARRVSRTEALRLAPALRVDGLRGGLLGWDGQLVDDARLVVGIARTAASLGAVVLTRCAAEQVTGGGAVLRDTLTGATVDVAARIVINAAGVWAGQVSDGIRLRPSRGTHLVVSPDALGNPIAALTVPVPGSTSRFVFALPSPEGHVYVGITDEEAPGPVPDVPRPSEAELDFLLGTLNSALARPLARADVLGSFAGLRPLLDSGSAGGSATADLSRRHAVVTGADGVVTVVGGKLTTYRRMAADALDTALARVPLPAAGPCRTKALPLVGADSPAELARVPAPAWLVRRFGVEAADVVALAAGDPELLRPIAPGIAITPAELRFSVQVEGALDVDDLLDRRTRIGLVARDRERALPAALAALEAQG